MGFSSKRDWVAVSLPPPHGKKTWQDVPGEPRPWQNTTRFAGYPHSKRGVPLPRRYKPRRKNKKMLSRVPCAPYNTSSYLMRAGKLGINAPLLSPATPALATPVISPSPWPSESLGDGQVANELGVNAYGSMNGRIRVRADESDVERDSGSLSCGESDTDHCGRPPADSVQQVEERIDHGLQRFEMLFTTNDLPQTGVVTDQEMHIQHLEEENLCLQQRVWAMSQELSHLRRRLGNDGGPQAASDESLGNVRKSGCAWLCGDENRKLRRPFGLTPIAIRPHFLACSSQCTLGVPRPWYACSLNKGITRMHIVPQDNLQTTLI